ncbi:putative FAD-dependent dehydrogenase [Sporomusaceae bacterium BoRhaA]|uniref:NAD(P)/FAD-dependent oxidoreductase n=1 Tax=Pelorhabdus rhamnosifermentans TaxID=2772457 RepID=UPI001C064940|nr:hypothetical protein [Pelorhabdus rhamnosifermentans]MBU2701726.1 putative FAD-dependent dehydrogenase [Pelorhabdus rhamnosifermentans]
MLRISNFRTAITEEQTIQELVAKRLKIPVTAIRSVKCIRQALDARRKQNISFVYTLDVETTLPERKVLTKLRHDKNVVIKEEDKPQSIVCGERKLSYRPIIVGFGPSGMLAAYTLAQAGFRPIVLERGADIDQRTKDVNDFWQTGQLNIRSNVQFGEGGAGTFSDGKLTTRVNDSSMSEVLGLFVNFGAPDNILYAHKPHIGTDRLQQVVKNLRQKVIELGGEVRFHSQVTGFTRSDTGSITSLQLNGKEEIAADVVLFGIGNSARDTYEYLDKQGVALEAKPFAIGVRIEHSQQLIDVAQFGAWAGHPKLGAADYALVYHDRETKRTAYSFCMCPGGVVVAGASEAGQVVTNGMSSFARASGMANSALVVNVELTDFGPGNLAGIAFQRHYEKLAFELAGSNYCAPVQSVGSFLHRRDVNFFVQPTYRPGVKKGDLRQCLPDFVTATLAKALPEFGRKIKGFADDGVIMTGVETRTSAPVRIRRDNHFQSENVGGLYPMGEGAGYAGGIMSAALDGLHVANHIIATYGQPVLK